MSTAMFPSKNVEHSAALQRFRAAVQKVIAIQRSSKAITSKGAGAEPGVDPRRLAADLLYGAIKQQCLIEVLDYSSLSSYTRRVPNTEFVNMLNDPVTSGRPPWAKVRWINIGGISWDVLKAVSLKYPIHPLALENILHTYSDASSSKSAYYAQHLFLRVLCLELASKSTLSADENVDTVQAEALKGAHIHVEMSPMFIFLFRDGVVITIQCTPDLKLTEPITNRLLRRDTLLRTTSDASFLVQALLDVVVDKALELTEECEFKMKGFERRLFLKPNMQTVSKLHFFCRDLNVHKLTLDPLKRVVYGLRRYDTDRFMALFDEGTSKPNVGNTGYLSHTSKIYLGDVHDHITYILTSLDTISETGENLIGYSFNTASYEMNVVMRRLTIITVICLPLTFLTGYFGMNFVYMWTTKSDNHSDLVFWIISLPVMAIVIPIFTMPDIQRLLHYMGQRKAVRAALKALQLAQS